MPIRLTIMKMIKDNKSWWEHGESKAFCSELLVEKKLSTVLADDSMEFPQEAKIRTSIWYRNFTSEYVW